MNVACRSAGISLTELLVSLVLSMLLMLVLMQQLLLITRQMHDVHEALDEAVELQWVLDVLRMRVRHAGFTPCRRLDHLDAIDTRDVPESLRSIEVQAGQEPKLSIRKMQEDAVYFVQRHEPYQLMIKDDRLNLNSDRPVLVADCEHAEVHELSHIQKTQAGYLLSLKKPLVFDYSEQMYVGAWVSEAFFFRKGTLFLKQHRVDALTAWVKQLSFELKPWKNYWMLRVNLISKRGRSQAVDIRVRMP